LGVLERGERGRRDDVLRAVLMVAGFAAFVAVGDGGRRYGGSRGDHCRRVRGRRFCDRRGGVEGASQREGEEHGDLQRRM
jgi:hypothetical protein